MIISSSISSQSRMFQDACTWRKPSENLAHYKPKNRTGGEVKGVRGSLGVRDLGPKPSSVNSYLGHLEDVSFPTVARFLLCKMETEPLHRAGEGRRVYSVVIVEPPTVLHLVLAGPHVPRPLSSRGHTGEVTSVRITKASPHSEFIPFPWHSFFLLYKTTTVSADPT
ncbi:hypothetical protein mRhiFer1_009297 [Rhinolophus ferrumequinum]|uniref:Uncharacterized protein n=1 Tax=Rhinolophus ferrumequinum TaxID=59479 RepID=A0A7J7RXQ6_RHIFE|nr:hypothetical protein mRhiFer1_009297 [Rhinolophus ferrumequinum]